MSHQVIWTKIVLEEFISQGNLTKLEEEIMRTRAAGWTRTNSATLSDFQSLLLTGLSDN